MGTHSALWASTQSYKWMFTWPSGKLHQPCCKELHLSDMGIFWKMEVGINRVPTTRTPKALQASGLPTSPPYCKSHSVAISLLWTYTSRSLAPVSQATPFLLPSVAQMMLYALPSHLNREPHTHNPIAASDAFPHSKEIAVS